MVARAKIARTVLTWTTAVISVFFVVATPAMADAVHVEIQKGDSSFLVDNEKGKIWWVAGECRREIPISRNTKSRDKQKSKKPSNIITSNKVFKDVQIGSHRLRLEQQFRFDMVSHAPTLQVFNSVRGGWSEVPIRVNNTCDSDLACRQRMELPLCKD